MRFNKPYWRLKDKVHAVLGEMWLQMEAVEDANESVFDDAGHLITLDPFEAVRIQQIKDDYWRLARVVDTEPAPWWWRFKPRRKEHW